MAKTQTLRGSNTRLKTSLGQVAGYRERLEPFGPKSNMSGGKIFEVEEN